MTTALFLKRISTSLAATVMIWTMMALASSCPSCQATTINNYNYHPIGGSRSRHLDKATISVPISPFSLSFRLDAENNEDANNSNAMGDDLEIIATAAQEFLNYDNRLENALMAEYLEEAALKSDLILEYDGVEIETFLPEHHARRSLLRSSASFIMSVRRIEGEDGGVTTTAPVVNLEGYVKFTAPQEIDPLDSGIPSELELTQLVKRVYINGEYDDIDDRSSFISIIQSIARGREGSSEWLTTLQGYETRDLIVGGAGGGGASDSDANSKEDNSSSDAQQAAQVQNNGAEGGSSSGSNVNIFIIIGAAGAGLSLILLIGGLCYAKRKGGDAHTKKMTKNSEFQADQHNSNNNNYNNMNTPMGSSSKKQISILRKSSKNTNSNNNDAIPPPPPPPPPLPVDDRINLLNNPSYDETDDESNAEFLMARQALNNPSRNDGGGRSGASVASNANNTYGDDMSYAFSVDADSIAISKMSGMDNINNAAIGAGGMASFQNEKGGTFRWNEEGTKMVYIPAEGDDITDNSDGGGVGSGKNNDGGRHQNGFVFDETKKKWVIAEKNVKFDPTTNHDNGTNNNHHGLRMTPPRRIQRSRTDDTEGATSQMTGVTDFSYDDVALDFARRTKSDASGNSSQNNGEDMFGMSGMSLDREDDDDDNVGGAVGNGSMDEEEGVEVVAPSSFGFGEEESIGEFVPNTNFEDDSTAFGGVSVFTGFSSSLGPTPVTPERVSPDDNSLSQQQIRPSRAASGISNEPGVIRPIQENAPFDEDIPFDEMPRRQNSNATKQQQKNKSRQKMVDSSPKAQVKIPSIMDDDSYSDGSVNSAEVLEDLNTLSGFMKDRKRSNRSSSGGGGSSRIVGRISSFGGRK